MTPHAKFPRVRYDGKFKGKVEQRTDPDRIGRLRVRVVGVHSNDIAVELLPWASPSSVAWKKGGRFWIPPVGEYVWVEFEDGNPEYPVWGGGWWGRYDETTAETPDGTSTKSQPCQRRTCYGPLMLSELKKHGEMVL